MGVRRARGGAGCGRRLCSFFEVTIAAAFLGTVPQRLVFTANVSAAINLMAGFAGLLMLDWHFVRTGLAPPWWLRLRIGLTAAVLLSLAPIVV